MKGLELCKRYFNEYGKKMLENNFADILPYLAAGLVGEGSECFGFDDELSRDHDFEPGFCIWVPREIYQKHGYALERAYTSLPSEFLGFERQKISPAYEKRHGVLILEDFYLKFLGTPSAPTELSQWLYLPSSSLAAASYGEVFFDCLGEFSKTRETLLSGYPEDILLKKLAAHLVFISQSGLYNYPRLISRGDRGAAQLAIFEFVRHVISVIYLLNGVYEPFYKWSYRGMQDFKILCSIAIPMDMLTISLSELSNGEIEASAKSESIEEIANEIKRALFERKYISSISLELEACAMQLQNKIHDPNLRNMHIMSGV